MVIYLKDLTASGRHGVNPQEKIEAQPFKLTIRLTVNDETAVQSDNLSDTLNWSEVRRDVIHLVESTSFNLIEKLAGEIAGFLLKDKRVESVSISIDKPKAFGDDNVPGITLTKSRAS